MCKFDKKIPKGSVLNCQLKVASDDAARWFKFELKPPKSSKSFNIIFFNKLPFKLFKMNEKCKRTSSLYYYDTYPLNPSLKKCVTLHLLTKKECLGLKKSCIYHTQTSRSMVKNVSPFVTMLHIPV